MAYGSPLRGASPSFKRHSLRLSADQPRKRISRFLRPDFFDPPAEDNFVTKHKKEKELETQKILKEIREKRNRSLDSNALSPEIKDEAALNDEFASVRKCLSPISNLINKERSRSTTPYSPILDNIKETTLDTSTTGATNSFKFERNDTPTQSNVTSAQNKETKLTRPKSYPIKNFETFDDSKTNSIEAAKTLEKEIDEIKVTKESRLIRPKSYPTSNISLEKNCGNRNTKNEEGKTSIKSNTFKEEVRSSDKKPDIEVNFNITLPKRKKPIASTEATTKEEPQKQNSNNKVDRDNDNHQSLTLKKYQILNETNCKTKELKNESMSNEIVVTNKETQLESIDTKISVDSESKKEDVKCNTTEIEANNKKVTVKKKIIKKVSTKSKTDLSNNQSSNDSVACSTEKKKVTKKIKDKDKAADDSTKSPSVTKKKSVLQSIGHKLEKLATSKSNSPDKTIQSGIDANDTKKVTKFNRSQRENSVPVNIDPPTESNLIKRAVTITDVAALENQPISQNKTTVFKVLGLFKKFEPKEKSLKSSVETNHNESVASIKIQSNSSDYNSENGKDKAKRPTSLLLNGLGRKNRCNKTTNNGVSDTVTEKEREEYKNENDVKNIRNSLKLDFSRLPRVKKIVPTDPVIEPIIMNVSVADKESSLNNVCKSNITSVDGTIDVPESLSRSRSRSRSTFSNSDIKSEGNTDVKDKYYFPETSLYHLPVRNRENLSPEREDLAERIRRKSFYSRFNERKQRRKSSLVGPGASEYDPLARIHSPPTEHKYDISPSSPSTYDISPGYSVGTDISPSTERYKSLLSDITSNNKGDLRYDGQNDKIDTYRSLDRNEFRKYPGSRSYNDYDQTSTYIPHRYSRTKSLFDSSESGEDQGISLLREPHKYNRTSSMYSPGNYATYRPKRTRNSAIILKESEKEPSPENILDKIRQRKISISVTRKLDPEKEILPRSTGPSKGEGDGTERVEKAD